MTSLQKTGSFFGIPIFPTNNSVSTGTLGHLLSLTERCEENLLKGSCGVSVLTGDFMGSNSIWKEEVSFCVFRFKFDFEKIIHKKEEK